MRSATLTNLVHQALRDLGGRAAADAVADLVRQRLDEDMLRTIQHRAFVDVVRSALRTVDADKHLPAAPCVSEQYVQLNLLTIGEYHLLISAQMRAATVRRQRATAYADECLKVHGIWIDPEQYAQEVTAS